MILSRSSSAFNPFSDWPPTKIGLPFASLTKPPPISTTPPLPRKVRFESVVLLAFAAAAPPSANVMFVAWQPESFRRMAFLILEASTPAATAALRAWSKFTPAAPMKFL